MRWLRRQLLPAITPADETTNYERDCEILLLLRNDRVRHTSSSLQAGIGDLAPLCDQHHARMRRSSSLPLIFHGWAGDQSCERRYDVLMGYYRGTYPMITDKAHCRRHNRPLYVCSYRGQIRRYACPVQGCNHVASRWFQRVSMFSLD